MIWSLPPKILSFSSICVTHFKIPKSERVLPLSAPAQCVCMDEERGPGPCRAPLASPHNGIFVNCLCLGQQPVWPGHCPLSLLISSFLCPILKPELSCHARDMRCPILTQRTVLQLGRTDGQDSSLPVPALTVEQQISEPIVQVCNRHLFARTLRPCPGLTQRSSLPAGVTLWLWITRVRCGPGDGMRRVSLGAR